MSSARIISCLLSVLYLSTFSVAQVPAPTAASNAAAEERQKAKEELEKKALELLNRTASDASSLRLPENRAYILSTSAELLWKFDAKRSREMFRNAMNDIMSAQFEAETAALELDAPPAASVPGETDRVRILTMLARRDAEMAQELMMQTRSQRVADAMARQQFKDSPPTPGMPGTPNNGYLATMELQLEQTIARFSAEQNPDKAIKLIRDAMAKSVSMQVWSMVQRVYSRDAEKGKVIAGEMVSKLLETDLSARMEERSVILSLLSTYKAPAISTPTPTAGNDKTLRLDDKQLRDLAARLAEAYVRFNVEPMMIMQNAEISRAIPLIEKLAPEKIAALKQKQSAISKAMPNAMKPNDAFARVSGPNSTPEEVIGAAGQVPIEQRTRYYELAVQKISRMPDEVRARNAIANIPDEKYRARATEALDATRISRLTAEGKLDEALRLIAGITKKSTKLEKLVSLAIGFYRKRTDKDRESAASIMEQARGLVTESPENLDDMDNLAQVVRGFTETEPERAFRLIEVVFSEIDSQVQAAATVSKYDRGNRSFKRGELLMSSGTGNNLLNRFQGNFRALTRADFDKMAENCERLQRMDAKLMVRMQVLQAAFAEDRPPMPQGPFITGP